VIGDTTAMYGLIDFVTVYSKSTATAQGGGQGEGGQGGGQAGGGQAGGGGAAATSTAGKINVNTAPREVLLTLPDLDDGDVTSLIQAREGQTGIDWVATALGDKAAGVTPYITGETHQFSADIVAVSADGRAYRRVRIVIDATDTANPPKIIYRRDLTADGWPLDPGVLQSLRAGNGPGSSGGLSTGLGGALGSAR
jgi:hypothetical protein